nr:MAG TPA: CHD-like protein [Caudoviricetes sp.]
MGVLQIIINICSTFGISGILLFLVKRHYEKKDEALKDNKQERKELREVIEKIAKQNDEQYAMIARQDEKINSLCDNIKALKQQEERNSQADRDMLRDAILRIYHRCYEVDGWIAVNDLESLQHMYNSYIELGGNGMIPSIHEKIINLPTMPPENKS